MARVCSEPGCPFLAIDIRHCEEHKPKPWIKTGLAARRRGGNGWDWGRTVKRILARDHGICRWCKGQAVTADHVTAVADGGSDDDANLVAACADCNDRRRREVIASRRGRPGTPCATKGNRS